MNLFKIMHVQWLRQFIVTLLVLGCALADVSELVGGGSNQQYTLEQAIRGTPNSDYPIYSEPPKTSFSCDKKDFGYYVDIEARCQVFRVCAHTDTSGMGFTFLCPNGTLFNQQFMVCDWYYNVNCAESEQFFGMNKVLGMKDGSDAKIMADVRKMMEAPFKSSDRSGNGRATLQPDQNPLTPPFGGGVGRNDRFNPVVPSFTGNGPSQGFVSGIPTRGGTIPPSVGGDGPIFVSNLGELSTDPNSAFDRQKSKVINVSTDSEDPTKAAAGTQVLTYPTNGGGGSRTGRKKKGNGYDRVVPKVDVNIHGFPDVSGSRGDTVNIGGSANTRRKQTGGASSGFAGGSVSIGGSQQQKTRGGSKTGNTRPKGRPTTISISEETYQSEDDDEEVYEQPGKRTGSKNKGKGTQISSGSEEVSDYDDADTNKPSKRRPGLPKPGKNSRGPGFNANDSEEELDDETPSLPSRQGGSNNQQRPSGHFNQPTSQQQTNAFGNSRGPSSSFGGSRGRTTEQDEIFNIVYSVLNERHGGLDGNAGGAQRRSDNFGSAPAFEIVPSIDLSSSLRQGINIPGFTGVQSSQSSFRHQGGQNQQQQQQFRPATSSQSQYRPSNQQRSSGGVEIIPARLVSQSSGPSNGRSQQNYYAAASQQQSFRQRPGRRRSGPNVEIVPVPLRHSSSSSSSSSSNPEGEATNDQPYAIPQSVRDIKASNFILNYNPLLSKPTASRDEILVQIVKAEDTYVNDGSGRARPLTGANASNTRNLPSNFAQPQPGTASQTGAVSPFDVTGGRPSSYDVPLNSVGPLDQTRATNGKSEAFKGYHY